MAIAVLLTLGLLIIVAAIFMDAGSLGFPAPVAIGIALFDLMVVIGLFIRSSWGMILGMVAGGFALISIPIGTIIGVMGLFAFIKAPTLFGPDRVLHNDLKAEFKHRKKLKKEAKRR